VAGERLCTGSTLPTSTEADPAVELFLERARDVAPDFAPGPGDLATIVEIVGRLDGLPLAIELAAARLHTLDVAEVAAGLDRRFLLLSAGYRTSSRHGSLSAAISWSFDQLDRDLQRIFADLSAFAGAFTVADAAAICGVDDTTTGAAVQQLAERSLLMRAPDRRYVLLETLRAFGAERLVAEGRIDEAGGRHARHQLDWVQHAVERLMEPGSTSVAEIDAAIPELRAALGWFLDHDQLELAGRLMAALFDYGFFRVCPDVLGWSERLTDADPDDRSPLAPLVWAISAYAAWMSGDWPRAGRGCAEPCERASGPVAISRPWWPRSAATMPCSRGVSTRPPGSTSARSPPRAGTGSSGCSRLARCCSPSAMRVIPRSTNGPTSCSPRSARRRRRMPPMPGTARAKRTLASTSNEPDCGWRRPFGWPS
jgi:hypothetical protein